jgi:hypothetical protein
MIPLSQKRVTFTSYFSNIITDKTIHSTSFSNIELSKFLQTLEEDKNYICWLELYEEDIDGEEIFSGPPIFGQILINKFSSSETIMNYFNSIYGMYNEEYEYATFSYIKIINFEINKR